MNGIISMANGSSSSLYGSIGYAIKDLIISKFPMGYFKQTTLSSELAVRNMRRLFGGPNNNIEMQKRDRPWISIQPTYSTMDRDGPLQNIPLTSNFDDLQYRVDKLYLFEAIRDSKNGFNLKFKLNRDRIEFDITVMTANLHSQLDIYKTIQNQIIWERPFSYRIALESVIPKQLVAIMSKYCNMDIEKYPDYIPMVLKRLNTCSAYPITYKLRNASATDEWFLYYTHNIIVTFSDLTIESGRRKNMTEDEYPITFRVSAEFNLPGVYFIDGDTDKLRNIDISIISKGYDEDNTTYIPIYTINNLYNKFPIEYNGMQLYGSTIFKTEASPNQLEEKVDISSVMDNNHIRAIRIHKSWNMNPDTLMKIYLLKDGDLLSYKKDYLIDWNSLNIIVKNPDNNATYRFIMYFNYQTVNEILSNTEYENNYDVDTLKDNKFPNKGLVNEEVTIHDSNSNWNKDADNMFTKEGASEEQTQDPNNIILEHDPEYCKGCEHEKVDPDTVLYKNKVIVNAMDSSWKKPSDEIYMKEHVPPEEVGKDDTFIIEQDEDYCGGKDHGKVDPDTVLYNNRMMIHSNDGSWKKVSEDTYLEGHVPPNVDKENTYVMNPDNDYCGDTGIDISEISIAGLDDESSITNADIHNSKVVEPPKISTKKFSSSAN